MEDGYEKTHWASYGHVFSSRLRKIRMLRGMSQERLAELAGMSRSAVSILERNEGNTKGPVDPRLHTVYKLARALDVPPVALLPAVGQRVVDICVDEGLEVDVRWPATAEDTVEFDPVILKGLRNFTDDAARIVDTPKRQLEDRGD